MYALEWLILHTLIFNFHFPLQRFLRHALQSGQLPFRFRQGCFQNSWTASSYLGSNWGHSDFVQSVNLIQNRKRALRVHQPNLRH